MSKVGPNKLSTIWPVGWTQIFMISGLLPFPVFASINSDDLLERD